MRAVTINFVETPISRFFLIAEIDKSNEPANITNLTVSEKYDKCDVIWLISLYNSILVPYFRRIFVRTNLFSTDKLLSRIFSQG